MKRGGVDYHHAGHFRPSIRDKRQANKYLIGWEANFGLARRNRGEKLYFPLLKHFCRYKKRIFGEHPILMRGSPFL